MSSDLEFFEWAANELDIAFPEMWYNIRCDKIKKLGGGPILLQYGNSLMKALQCNYPEYSWQPWKYARSRIWMEPIGDNMDHR
jgi:hypothetical protein